MTIWCQLGKRQLNTKKSLIYTTKKRPVFQEDQVPLNEGSATPKQLVLVRTEHKSGLSGFVFPAAASLPSPAWLLRPCNLAHGDLGSLRPSQLLPRSAGPSLSRVRLPTRVTAFVFLLRRSLASSASSFQNESVPFRDTFCFIHLSGKTAPLVFGV